MSEEKEAQKQQQMGSLETQSPGLLNPDEKSSTMAPSPIIGTSSNNNNDPLIADGQTQQAVDERVNADEGDKAAASMRTANRGGKKRITGKTTGGEGKDGNGAAGGREAAGGHDMHIWTERERRKKMRNMFATLHSLLPQLPPKADKSTIVDEAVRCIKSLEITLENLEKIKQERLRQAQLQSASTTTIADGGHFLSFNSQPHPTVSREAFMADHGSSIIHNSSNNNPTNAITIGSSNSLSLPGVVNNPVGFQTWSSSNVVINICGDQAQFNVCSLKKPGLFTSICAVFEKYKIEVLSAHVSSDDRRCFYMIHAQANGGPNEFEGALSAEETFRQAAGEMTLWLS
ncbi:transcription factor bHLH95-like [Neltuma alba]|uniref:transcription factor bHLH95-like n=1 Tax=Neltuma alba TaxID=207710 RepID=UPI0010A2D0BC|nr:transcription factor bHLH95-like [Prosopis alba]